MIRTVVDDVCVVSVPVQSAAESGERLLKEDVFIGQSTSKRDSWTVSIGQAKTVEKHTNETFIDFFPRLSWYLTNVSRSISFSFLFFFCLSPLFQMTDSVLRTSSKQPIWELFRMSSLRRQFSTNQVEAQADETGEEIGINARTEEGEDREKWRWRNHYWTG